MSGGETTLARLRAGLASRPPRRLEIPGFRPAAVLVPVLQAETGLGLLFTVRGEMLSNHAGQIAFPGGGLDPGESVREAALRETWEEIGVRVTPDSIVGELPDHPSPAGFVVTPVVAVVPWPQPLRPNPDEVAEIFSAPLEELGTIVPRWEERVLQGLHRRIHFYAWGERLIWGFTGNVVKDLLDVVEAGGTGEAHRS